MSNIALTILATVAICGFAGPVEANTIYIEGAICSTATESFPSTGEELTRFKCFDPGSFLASEHYFHGGSEISSQEREQYVMKEALADFSAHGSLESQSRWLELFCLAAPYYSVNVDVWSKTDSPNPQMANRREKPGGLSFQFLNDLELAHRSLESACLASGASKCEPKPGMPVVSVTLPCSNLRSLVLHPAASMVVADRSDELKPASAVFATSVVAVPRFQYQSASILGSGTSVCVIEGDKLLSSSYVPSGITLTYMQPSGPTNVDHSQWVSGVITSTAEEYGIAPLADLSVANWVSGLSYTNSIQWCATQGTTNWNFSQGGVGVTPGFYFDYQAKISPYPLVAAASGNLGATVAVDNAGLNILIVGASDENGTTTRSSHLFAGSFSQYLNQSSPNSDWELPSLVAPGVSITAGGLTKSGTSGATPAVAATGALLDEINGLISSWPEAKRALILVGANENISGDSNPFENSSTDDQDGVGELNVNRTLTTAVPANLRSIGGTASRYGYDFYTIYPSDFTNSWYQNASPGGSNNPGYRVSVPAQNGLSVRAVLTWDGTACGGSNPYTTSCTSRALDADLDLFACRTDVSPMDCSWVSASYDNSTEMVQFSAVSGATYELFVRAYSFSASFTYFSIAWAVDTYN